MNMPVADATCTSICPRADEKIGCRQSLSDTLMIEVPLFLWRPRKELLSMQIEKTWLP